MMSIRPESVTTVGQLNEAIATEAFKRPFPACVGVATDAGNGCLQSVFGGAHVAHLRERNPAHTK